MTCREVTYTGEVLPNTQGNRTWDNASVMVMDNRTRQVDRLEHHVKHSPTGFAWGYYGSGPADLARCILWDHLHGEPAPGLYQDFKADVVAQFDPIVWRLSTAEVEGWLEDWRVGHPDWAETVEASDVSHH